MCALYIIVKDHKVEFRELQEQDNKFSYYIYSQNIFASIILNIKQITSLLFCTITVSIIKWFGNIDNKHLRKFMQFDIVEFYATITKSILQKALEYGIDFIPISEFDINIAMHAMKSLLFYNNSVTV